VTNTDDLHDRGMVYFQTARFLWEEGRDHLEVARQARQMELANWKQAAKRGVLDLRRARVIVITAKESSCPACRALEGVEFTLHEAMEKTRIPAPDCTHETSEGRRHGWCRCVYGLHFDR
jgi:hypothetical protein